MSKSKRSLEEQIKAADERYLKMFEKAKQYEERKKQLERKKKEEDRKARTHSLIVIGGVVSSVLNRDFVEGDDMRLMNFLKQQERNGNYFSKAMNKGAPDTAKKETSSDTESHDTQNGHTDDDRE